MNSLRPLTASAMLLIAASAAAAQLPTLERVWDGTNDPDDRSSGCSLSSNGRWVAFESSASNLVPGDINGVDDIFVFDRLDRTIERVSVGPLGVEANNDSGNPSISADGRFIAFDSKANNLVAFDSNKAYDVFVHDRATGTTTRVSESSSGAQGNSSSSNASISADGTKVAFQSSATLDPNANGTDIDIFVKDLTDGSLTLVTVTPTGGVSIGLNDWPCLSADGSRVAFQSGASDLVAGDTNGTTDLFVADLTTGSIARVNVDSSGNQSNGYSFGPILSADGKLVVFNSNAANLVPGDSNGVTDVFLKDLVTGAVTRLSVAEDGTEATATSDDAWISGDGSRVVFSTKDDSLVPGDTNGQKDVLLLDRTTGKLSMASVSVGGLQGDMGSFTPHVSGDGRFVGFQSWSTLFDPADNNAELDVFVAGPHLTLDSFVGEILGNDVVGLDVWRSTPNYPVFLYYVPPVGAPIKVLGGRFNGSGTWSVNGVVPAGLTGTYDFMALALNPDGQADLSNLTSITIQ